MRGGWGGVGLQEGDGTRRDDARGKPPLTHHTKMQGKEKERKKCVEYFLVPWFRVATMMGVVETGTSKGVVLEVGELGSLGTHAT